MREPTGMEKRPILLVEDDPDDVTLTLLALDENVVANEVVVVSDGVEALDYLFGTGSFAGQNAGIFPAVVLLDLKLPRVGGLEVLQRLRADPRTEFLPLVVLTSSDEESDVVRSYRLGANSYVRKPIEITQFNEAVRQLGLYWLLVNRVPNMSPQQ